MTWQCLGSGSIWSTTFKLPGTKFAPWIHRSEGQILKPKSILLEKRSLFLNSSIAKKNIMKIIILL